MNVNCFNNNVQAGAETLTELSRLYGRRAIPGNPEVNHSQVGGIVFMVLMARTLDFLTVHFLLRVS